MVKRSASEALAEPSKETCPICSFSTGKDSKWQPQIWAPFQRRNQICQNQALQKQEQDSPNTLSCAYDDCIRSAVPVADQDMLTMRCHLECLQWLIWQEGGALKKCPDYVVEPQFETDLLLLLKYSPELLSRSAQVRVCVEEMRIAQAVAGCLSPKEPLPPGTAAFTLEGLEEIRVSSCPGLLSIPSSVSFCTSMKSLVLISDGLVELPEAVGELRQLVQLFLNGNFLTRLPKSAGELPVLEELCVDSNQLETLPDFVSPRLTLFSAPANRLRELPSVQSMLDRLEVQGNELPLLQGLGPQVRWDGLRVLKVMGNKLTSLPDEVGLMRSLTMMMVAGNQLTELPAGVSDLRRLEWLLVYSNRLEQLPEGVLLSPKLTRVLLEGNPLSAAGLETLLKEARTSQLHALCLDSKQVQGYTNEEELPSCVSLGDDVSGALASKYYMKVVRASQLRREPGVRAAGTPGGPPTAEESPADLIVVAFAASQGEPEWLGVLRRLAAAKRASQLPPADSSLATLLESSLPNQSLQESAMTKLWSKCQASAEDTTSQMALPSLPLADFDVLVVVDHCMCWYGEDAQQFSAALNAVVRKRKKSLFVGASMGGFGALLHGGCLANAVLAFGPQSRLEQALLRPPAKDIESLKALSDQCRSSVEQGNARGACVEVHCAADEHGWHGLSLPLADLCLTVHPLLPRKPFAKLLDRAELLAPVLSDAIYRLLQAPPCHESGGTVAPMAEPRINVAQWTTSGTLFRYWAARQETLQALFVSEQVRHMPRPGDWFCASCGQRNMNQNFFCSAKGPPASGSQGESSGRCPGSLLDLGVIKIPGSRLYPRPGDWGCGKCGAALCAYDRYCPHCWSTQEHEHARVVT